MGTIEMIIRIVLAILVGGLIGFEREKSNRPAGFRTHILVSVGAAVISIIQMESIEHTIFLIHSDPSLANALKADMGRMGAQVVTGVGFLGAGTIIRERGVVKGLTTAASLWVVACIGLAVGMGMYILTAIATVGTFLALVFLKKIEERFISRSQKIEIAIEYKRSMTDKVPKELEKVFRNSNVVVKGIEQINDGEENAIEVKYYLEVPFKVDLDKMTQEIYRKKGVLNTYIEEE